ncbi:hypothetical protein GW17_00055504 [Ensete ventricosum]|nr:hypothetical protein GW17_00055504 [Ensete ventricosum]
MHCVGSSPFCRSLIEDAVVLHELTLQNALQTINDVLVGVTSAGLSRYLSRRNEQNANDDDKKKKEKELPSNIRLRSTLLVNIRPSPGIHVCMHLSPHKIFFGACIYVMTDEFD